MTTRTKQFVGLTDAVRWADWLGFEGFTGVVVTVGNWGESHVVRWTDVAE